MGWHCGKCGAFTTRGVTVFDEKGVKLREFCKYCNPENFEVLRDPSDNKIYTGPEAFPHLYKRDKNDVFQAKDELLADTAALWDGGPTERAVRQKQATRRTEPMSKEEIAEAKHWGEEKLAEAMRKGGTAAVAAMLSR